MGGKMLRGESLTLEWNGPLVSVTIRGKPVGTTKDKAFAEALQALYLGKAAVSPTLKDDIKATLAV